MRTCGMIATLRQLFKGRPDTPPPAIPPGRRVYAIGDIHGRLDLFVALATAIEADDIARDQAETTIILLGDLIDRGPDSATVIECAMAWKKLRDVRVIAGNHEEMLLVGLAKDAAFRAYLRIGGRETILSYPLDHNAFRIADLEEARAMALAAIPPEHIAFIETLEDRVAIGDYLFVHAGIMPKLPIEEQRGEDLRWIREPFLTSTEDHGCVVVHGHTITDTACIRPNRIGIDTGAFMSGRLTAIGLEGTARWLIEAAEEDATIVTRVTDLGDDPPPRADRI